MISENKKSVISPTSHEYYYILFKQKSKAFLNIFLYRFYIILYAFKLNHLWLTVRARPGRSSDKT